MVGECVYDFYSRVVKDRFNERMSLVIRRKIVQSSQKPFGREFVHTRKNLTLSTGLFALLVPSCQQAWNNLLLQVCYILIVIYDTLIVSSTL
jgi:hypothetical protein